MNAEEDCAVISQGREEISNLFDSLLECPVLTLPPEITSEIFIHCRSYPAVPSLDNAPIVFTRVCGAWRHVAISTPKLWDSMWLAPSTGCNIDHYIYMLDMWFSRAVEQPLYLKLDPALGDTEAQLKWARCIPSLLERHSRQLKTLIINFRLVERPQFSPAISFPRLENLEIITSLSSRASGAPSITAWKDTTAWKNTPALRHVSLFGFSPADFFLPWGNLTSIQCGSISLHECLALLRETPSLLKFTLQGLKSTTATDPESMITLPLLRSLEIWYNGLAILRHITLPLLEILNLGRADFTPAHSPQLLELISRSRCELPELAIAIGGSYPLFIDPAIQLLYDLSSLTTLRVERSSTGTIVQILQRMSDASFLPQLECLTVKIESLTVKHYKAGDKQGIFNGADSMFDELVDSLEMRWNPPEGRFTHLASFKLEGSPFILHPLCPEIIQRLKTLSAEGMDLSIQIGDYSCI
ncbi:hypothetical protein C8J57DRAFT_1603610 [Mycena rebaudengoi]|nr:hypothetical protein C8J57DRAFT_1603610 [Mycena rebaudengoi]